MPELNSDILTGLNKQTLFDLNLDTAKRIDSILNIPNQPTGVKSVDLFQDFRQPEQKPDNSLQGLPEEMSLGQAILSGNSKLQDLASSVMKKDLETDPYHKYNLGKQITTPYEQGAKFVNKKYGYDALNPNTEDFYYKNEYEANGFLDSVSQKLISNPLRFIGRVAGGAALKLGQGVGYLGAMINPTNWGDGFIEHLADNSFSKTFEQAEQGFKDNWVPVYKQAGFDEKGLFSQLGDWTFWNEKFSDGVAFMIAATADSLIGGGIGELGALGTIGKVAINTEKVLSKLGSIGKYAGRGIDYALKASTGAEDLAGVAGWARRVAGEAAFEAHDGFNQTKDQLIKDRNNGLNNYTNEQINSEAGKNASARFKDNLLILGASGAFENKFIFQPLRNKFKGLIPESTPNAMKGTYLSNTGELIKKTYKNELGKIIKDPLGRLQFYGSRAAGATIAEGYWEENAQLASERLHTGKSNYKTDNSLIGDIIAGGKQLAKQTYDASTWLGGKGDKDVAESIGLGALIGIAGTSIISKYVTKERKNALTDRDRQIDDLNTKRSAFLSLNQIYKTDAQGNPISDENGLVVDENKLKTVVSGLHDFTNRQVDADNIKDPLFKKLVKNDLLSQYTYAAIKAGIYDKVLDKFENLNTNDIKGFGVDVALDENASDYAQAIKEYKKIYDDVESSTITAPKQVYDKDLEKYINTPRDFQIDEEARKNYLYQTLSQKRNSGYIKNIISNTIIEGNTDVLNDSNIQTYNTLLFRQKALQEFEDLSQDNNNYYKDHIAQSKKEIEDGLKEIKDSLKDKLESKELSITPEGLIITKNRAALKGVAKDIANSQEFTNYAQLGQLTNSEEQFDFISNKLKSTHQDFIDYREYLASISKKDEKADSEQAQKDEDTTAQTTKINEPIVTPYSPDVNSLAKRMSKREKFTTPEDIEFFTNNKEAIEKKVQELKFAPKANDELQGENLPEETFVEENDALYGEEGPISEFDLNSGKILITKTINNKIEEIKNNSSFIKLTEDEKNYVNTKTGKIYERVTSYINEKEIETNRLLESSQIIGNKIDELVRDFFSNNLKKLEDYNITSDSEIIGFIKKLKEVKNALDKREEQVLANDIILYNDEIGVAGTVDLLTIDKDGNYRIYDMKTMRGNNFTNFYQDDDSNKYESIMYGKSKKQKHTEQLSLYRILLNNTHNILAKTIGIMPIEISYNAGDVTTSKLNLLKGVELKPLDKVKEAELKVINISEIKNEVLQNQNIETNDVEETANLSEAHLQNINNQTSIGDMTHVDVSNAIADQTPAKQTNDQTNFENQLFDQEVLKNDEYSNLIAKFVQEGYLQELLKTHTPVIINDNIDWIDRIPENTESEKEYKKSVKEKTKELGQVIVFKKGEEFATFKELGLSDKYPNIPIITSFSVNSFDKNSVGVNKDIRAENHAKREGKTKLDVLKEYQFTKDYIKQVKADLAAGKITEFEINVLNHTEGIFPKAKDGNGRLVFATVKERFNLPFEVVVLTKNNADKYNYKYLEGTVLADFGKGKFLPVDINTLDNVTFNGENLFDNVNALLNFNYVTESEANKVKIYLKQLVYTTATEGFIVYKEDNHYKISIPKPLEKERLNVNSKVLTNAITMEAFSVKNNILSSSIVSTEEYKQLIESNVITPLKKITDSEGNLYTEKVNPYFTFNLFSKEYYDKLDGLNKSESYTQIAKDTLIERINKSALNNYEKLRLIQAINEKPIKQSEINIPSINPFASFRTEENEENNVPSQETIKMRNPFAGVGEEETNIENEPVQSKMNPFAGVGEEAPEDVPPPIVELTEQSQSIQESKIADIEKRRQEDLERQPLATKEQKQEALNTIKEGLVGVRTKADEIITSIESFNNKEIEEDVDDYLNSSDIIRDNPIGNSNNTPKIEC